jgi:hypothetical protein
MAASPRRAGRATPRMSDDANPLATAMTRLEAAVERLARAASRAAAAPAAAPRQGELAALAARLDATIAKLRAALGEDEEDGDPAGGELEQEGDAGWAR